MLRRGVEADDILLLLIDERHWGTLEGLDARWQRALREGISKCEIEHRVERHTKHIALCIEAPSPRPPLLLPPEIHQTQRAAIDVRRREAVQQGRQHEIA